MNNEVEQVSVVAPVYNEEGAIAEFVQRVIEVADSLKRDYDFEIVLIDDGSSDGSLAILREMAARDPRIVVIQLRRNFGQTAALQAGLDVAGGDILVTLDSDLQHFPEEIPRFLETLNAGYDMVCGWRNERAEGVARRWPSRVANWMLRQITGLPFHDFGTTFRAYRADLAKELQLFGDFHRFIPALGSDLGASITEIPIKNVERTSGKGNYGLGRTLGVFLDMFVLLFFIRYIRQPMRAFGQLAVLTFTVGFFIISVMVVLAYWYDFPMFRERPGWFLLAVMLMLASVQIMIAGILAEILARIHFGVGGMRTYRTRKIWRASEEHA